MRGRADAMASIALTQHSIERRFPALFRTRARAEPQGQSRAGRGTAKESAPMPPTPAPAGQAFVARTK